MITPMSHYHSAPPSPRVAMTHADAKPPAYLARFQQHVAMGLSPAQAMAEIERADGHRRGLPISAHSGNGGKGKPRPNHRIPTRDLVIPHLTRDWQAITPEFIALVGCAHYTIRMEMKRLVIAGVVECQRSNGNRPSVWRLA